MADNGYYDTDLQGERASGSPRTFEVPADGYVPRGFAMLHSLQLRDLTPAEKATASDPDAWAVVPVTEGVGGLLVRHGVTTEEHRCPRIRQHSKHLWQPGERTEYFTCFGQSLLDDSEQGSCSVCHGTSFRAPDNSGIWWHKDGRKSNACRREGATFVPDQDDDYCDHPNGFGVNGCPCGGVAADEEDRPTVTNTTTGANELAVDCPAEDCKSTWPESRIRGHLQVEHGWTGDQWAGWSERTGFGQPPDVPEPIKAAVEAAEVADQAAAFRFLNPEVRTEDLVPNPVEALLTEWWMDRAEEEARSVVPKAVEYGSNSLMQLGRKMAQLQGRTVDDGEALELGCWANLVQKVERFTDSVMRGERCSDDTVYDIGIYVKMVQRIRDAGSWPGVPRD